MKTKLLLISGLVAVVGQSWAVDPAQPAKAGDAADFVAHEWGTFTSVQGADGVQLEWNPLVVSDLPKFVYDARTAKGHAKPVMVPGFVVASKAGLVTRQRMETPVIYFYSGQPRNVDIEVSFPNGQITEWYPELTTPSSPASSLRFGAAMLSRMKWGNVSILPGNGGAEAAQFPKDGKGSHYYAARETDASALRVKTAEGQEQTEKFLFYRGVGQFEAPLRVTHWGERAEEVRLTNQGKLPLGPFFVYSVRGDRAALMEQPVMKTGEMADQDLKFDEISAPLSEVRKDLAAKLQAALTKAGLYEKEAAAMVKTWDDSWLGEPGTRVLYVLPQAWSDEVLPLKISPAPKETKRVFVGRAELITPSQEWALLKQVVKFAEGTETEKKAAAAAVAGIGLGRFADAAIRRLQQSGPDTQGYRAALSDLLDASRKLETTPAKAQPQPATASTR